MAEQSVRMMSRNDDDLWGENCDDVLNEAYDKMKKKETALPGNKEEEFTDKHDKRMMRKDDDEVKWPEIDDDELCDIQDKMMTRCMEDDKGSDDNIDKMMIGSCSDDDDGGRVVCDCVAKYSGDITALCADVQLRVGGKDAPQASSNKPGQAVLYRDQTTPSADVHEETVSTKCSPSSIILPGAQPVCAVKDMPGVCAKKCRCVPSCAKDVPGCVKDVTNQLKLMSVEDKCVYEPILAHTYTHRDRWREVCVP